MLPFLDKSPAFLRHPANWQAKARLFHRNLISAKS
jgi:hypothetical protein